MAAIYDLYIVETPKRCAPDKTQITIIGRVQDKDFHAAELSARLVQEYQSDKLEVVSKSLCEVDWKLFLVQYKRMVRGMTWSINTDTVVFLDGEYLGDAIDLHDWLKDTFSYEEYRPWALFEAITTLETREFFARKKRTHVFMAVSIGDEQFSGPLIFELFDDLCPKAVRNFRNLCASTDVGKTYADTVLHRVVKSGWLQGGDVVDGSGGNSISSFGEDFNDECFEVKHDRKGILGMANNGANTNGSQFYITFEPSSWMDLKHVAFGRLVTGWELLHRLEEVEVMNQRPVSTCRILSCGEWKPP